MWTITAWWSARCYVLLARTDRGPGRRAGASQRSVPFDLLVSRFEAVVWLSGIRD